MFSRQGAAPQGFSNVQDTQNRYVSSIVSVLPKIGCLQACRAAVCSFVFSVLSQPDNQQSEGPYAASLHHTVAPDTIKHKCVLEQCANLHLIRCGLNTLRLTDEQCADVSDQGYSFGTS